MGGVELCAPGDAVVISDPELVLCPPEVEPDPPSGVLPLLGAVVDPPDVVL